MAALNELVTAARSGTLRASWMTGSTITITNLGDTGADLVHGVISPPQVALVGFGRSRQRPWVVDGLLTIRPVVTATLAADGLSASIPAETVCADAEMLRALRLVSVERGHDPREFALVAFGVRSDDQALAAIRRLGRL